MRIHCKVFGPLTDILTDQDLTIPDTFTLGNLREWLTEQYPALHEKTFSLAVNHQLADKDTLLREQDEIALLPPFSGG